MWQWILKQFYGTKVTNGVPGEYSIQAGWLAKLVIAAILGLLATAVNRAFYISSKIDVIDERTLISARETMENNAMIRAVASDLAAKWEQAQATHSTFLTKDEFYHYMAPEIHRPKDKK